MYNTFMYNTIMYNTQYTLFGEVTAGLEVLDKIEQVETKKEGIFVMPLQRIQIDSSYGM